MTTVEELLIRTIDPEEEAAARRFFSSRYPLERREDDFRKRGELWRWKYFRHPGGRPGIIVAEHDGRIVGVIGTNLIGIRTPRGVESAVWGCDLLIDPAVRGMGIGKKLVDTWKGSSALTIGKGFGDIAYSLYTNRGFTGVWGFTRMHIVLSRTRLAAKLLRSKQRRNLLRLAKAFARWNPRLRRGRDSSISVSETPPPGAVALWEATMRKYRFAYDRDEKYFAWRFTAHPAHRYHFVELKGPGGPSGLAIVRIAEGRNPLGIIADLIVDPGDRDAVRALLAGALSLVKSKGACAALVELPPALIPTVSRAFPCSFRDDFAIVVNTTDGELVARGIYEAANWYVGRSDSDTDC